MGVVEKVTVSLTQETADFLRDAVEKGGYASPSDVVGEAVREWKERRDLLGYSPEELGDMVREAEGSGTSRFATMDDLKTEARRLYAAKSTMKR
jgi:antitoxin ParD1/3/4